MLVQVAGYDDFPRLDSHDDWVSTVLSPALKNLDAHKSYKVVLSILGTQFLNPG